MGGLMGNWFIVRCADFPECLGTVQRQTLRCSGCGRLGDPADGDFRRLVSEVAERGVMSPAVRRRLAQMDQ